MLVFDFTRTTAEQREFARDGSAARLREFLAAHAIGVPRAKARELVGRMTLVELLGVSRRMNSELRLRLARRN